MGGGEPRASRELGQDGTSEIRGGKGEASCRMKGEYEGFKAWRSVKYWYRGE